MTAIKKKMTVLLWASLVINFGMAMQIDTLDLEEVIITEPRIKRTLPATPYAVQVISKEEILSAPYTSVEELLATHSSVDIRRKGPNDIQSDIAMRGGSFEQVLILIDGIKMNDPQTGHHNLNLPLDKSAIDHIEIVTGAAARRYGQNAYAGVVHIITKKASKNGFRAGIEGASYGTYAGELGGEISRENIKSTISARYEKSDGYRYNTDYDRLSVWSSTSFGSSDLIDPWRLQLSWLSKNFGANGFYASPDFADQYEEVQTSLVGLSKTYRIKEWKITPQLYWRRNQDEYVFVRDNPSLYRNLHIGNIVGLETSSRHVWSSGQALGLGLEIKQDYLRSSNLGVRNRTVLAVTGDYQIPFSERWEANLGLTYNYYSDFGSFFFPGVDLSYKFPSGIRFYANTSISSRIPSYTDLYYSDPANEGNPDLKPERATNMEIGLRQAIRKSTYSLTGFYRHSKDQIDWIKNSESDPWKPINILEIDTYGLEANWSFNPDIRWLSRISLGYTYVMKEPQEEENFLSRYVLENLRNNVVVGIEIPLWSNLQFSLQGRYVDRVNLENYGLIDAKINWQKSNWILFGEGQNLTDETYSESNLVPMPGRNFRVGIKYQY